MSVRTMLIMVSALMCAGVAAVGVNQVLSGSGHTGSTKEVMVAKLEIPRGTTLTKDMLETRSLPRSMAPEGAICLPDDAIGRTVLNHLVKGELLLDLKLAPKGTKGGIAGMIPPGMRAIAIQIPNVATGVGGFVLPGNKVDVLITMNDESRGDTQLGSSTLTLLENVEILAVDQRIDAPAENKVDAKEMRSVTLLVNPDQAARLNLAMNRGTLHLSLRNPTDQKTAEPKAAVMSDIRPTEDFDPLTRRGPDGRRLAAKKKAEPAPAAPVRTITPGVRVIRHTQESVIRIQG